MDVAAKTKIRAILKRASVYKHVFKTSHCIVPISVGQAYHEGEKFAATMRLIRACPKC